MRTTFWFITERTLTMNLVYHAGAAPFNARGDAALSCYTGAVPRDFDDELEPRRGPLEAFFQEAVRRAAQLGFSGFFTTEEAVRRAFSDAVPPDWLDYLNRRGSDLRTELLDRMSSEFGEWLRQIDMAQIMSKLLDEHEFELKISVSSKPRRSESAPELSLLSRRK
jgi:hypothetical protein